MTQPAYDAFFSYSTESGKVTSVRLSGDVHKLSAPWWRTKSRLSVFRDDLSLTPGQSLPKALKSALIDSRWLVVICSEGTRDSYWVNKEVDIWLKEKGPNNIILVHSSGNIKWDDVNKCYSDESDAIPEKLHDVFKEEDQQIYSSVVGCDDEKGYSSDKWRSAVISIISALRGENREVTAYRLSSETKKVTRVRRAAIASIAILSVLALIAGTISYIQSRQIHEQNIQALANATARKSQQLLSSDPGLARLAALQAWNMNDNDHTRAALLKTTLDTQHLVNEIVLDSFVSKVAGSSQKNVIVAAQDNGKIKKMSWPTGSLEHEFYFGDDAVVDSISLSSDGRTMTASGGDPTFKNDERKVVVWRDSKEILNLTTGDRGNAAVSPSGGTVAVSGVDDGVKVIKIDDNGDVLSTDIIAANIKEMALPDDESIVMKDGSRVDTLSLDTGIVLFSVHNALAYPDQYPSSEISIYGDYVLGEEGVAPTSQSNQENTKPDKIKDLDISERREFNTRVNPSVSPDGNLIALVTKEGVGAYSFSEDTIDPSFIPLMKSQVVDDLVAISGDSIISVSGKSVHLWSILKQADFVTDIVSPVAMTCDVCHVTSIIPSSDGSNFALQWVMGSGTFSVLSFQENFEGIVLENAFFLTWDGNDVFYAVVDGELRSYKMGEDEPIESWSLPGWKNPDLISAVSGATYDGEKLKFSDSYAIYEFDKIKQRISRVEVGYQIKQISEYGEILLDQGSDQWFFKHTDGSIEKVPSHSYISDSSALISTTLEGDITVSQNSGDESYEGVIGPNSSIAMSSNGDLIVWHQSASVLNLYSRKSRSSVATFELDGNLYGPAAVAFSPDGSKLIYTYQTRDITQATSVIALDPKFWQEEVCNHTTRTISDREWEDITKQSEVTARNVCG